MGNQYDGDEAVKCLVTERAIPLCLNHFQLRVRARSTGCCSKAIPTLSGIIRPGARSGSETGKNTTRIYLLNPIPLVSAVLSPVLTVQLSASPPMTLAGKRAEIGRA